MDNNNEIVEVDQSLDVLISNSIELIQYARKLAAKQVNIVQLMTPKQCLGNLQSKKLKQCLGN